MRGTRAARAAGWCVAAGFLLALLSAPAQPDEKRTIRGQVLDENEKPVALAIVHVKNVTTKKRLSVVTNKEGRYQFNDLEMKHDYKIYAEWRDRKSRTRTVSQFDTRPLVRIHLHLQPPEKSEEKKEKDEKDEKDDDESA